MLNPLLNPTDRDEKFENTIRPSYLDDFIGQTRLKKNLRVFIKAADHRKEALDHVILAGPPGLGKTTLAHIISVELNVSIRTTTGPLLEKPGDLAGILTSLKHGDILFIDEIHRLNTTVEEYLYSAMEDFKLDIIIDSGPHARSIQLSLEPFTLIGATTRKGLLTAPLLTRFGIDIRLNYYEIEELAEICLRSAKILNVKLHDDGALEIAKRSRGTPRVANRLLRRTRDFAQVEHSNIVDKIIVDKTLNALDVDANGLDEMDIKILDVIIKNYQGGPVGLKTLSVAVSEDVGTLEDVYEPFLIRSGFLQRTSKGRIATNKAFSYLGIKYPHSNIKPNLFSGTE